MHKFQSGADGGDSAVHKTADNKKCICIRDGAVHKIVVRKLHRSILSAYRTAPQKVCELNTVHRKSYRKPKYNG